jgi:hypothetical protein
MKLKIFYTIKEMVTKLKRLPTEWERAFAIYISNKELITRIHQELKNSKLPQNQWPNEVMGKWTEQRVFSKEEVQMAKKHLKKMLNIPDHRRNANQNHTKISFQAFLMNGYHQYPSSNYTTEP